MLDPHLFRVKLEFIQAQLKRRAIDFDADLYINLENRRKEIQIKTQQLQNKRNLSSKSIGQAKAKGEDIHALLDQVQGLGEQLKVATTELAEIQVQIQHLMQTLPNILDASVPAGNDADDNITISSWGNVPEFDFAIKHHVDLGALHQGIDFEVGTTISSARFVVLKGNIARLHRAIIQFMLDTHIDEHGYFETYVPYIVNADSLYATGQLPKFVDDLFKVGTDSDLYLIPTAEVPVTNIVRNKMLDSADMPIKIVCHTPCFRREAGAYGQDVRGLIRQHQFEKVELVWVTKASESEQAHEQLTYHAENILKKLNLAYRKVLLCSGDTGFSAAKTYDLEVWLPGQKAYREISSCSHFKDFQARRLKARWRNPETGQTELVHTLNGSGLAAGRTLVAIMENYQTVEGNIIVPEVLQSYMGGVKVLKVK